MKAAAGGPCGPEAEEGIQRQGGCAGSPAPGLLAVLPLPVTQRLWGKIYELARGSAKHSAGRWPKGTAFSPSPPPPSMLRSNRVSCIHNDSFVGLRNVRLLSLYDNQIATISPGAFDTLQALSTL